MNERCFKKLKAPNRSLLRYPLYTIRHKYRAPTCMEDIKQGEHEMKYERKTSHVRGNSTRLKQSLP